MKYNIRFPSTIVSYNRPHARQRAGLWRYFVQALFVVTTPVVSASPGFAAARLFGADSTQSYPFKLPKDGADEKAKLFKDVIQSDLGLTSPPVVLPLTMEGESKYRDFLLIITASDVQHEKAKKIVESVEKIDYTGKELKFRKHALKYITSDAAVELLSSAPPLAKSNQFNGTSHGAALMTQPASTLQFTGAISETVANKAATVALVNALNNTGGTHVQSGGQNQLDSLNLSAITNAGGGAGGATPSPPRNPYVMLYGTDSELDKLECYLNEIDVEPNQVLIEAKIVEMSRDDINSFGVTWADTTGRLAGGTLTEKQLPSNNVLRFGSFSRSAAQLNASLQASAAKGKAKLIADPTIAVQDQTEAGLFIGDKIKYVSASTVSANGVVNVTVTDQNAGVTLGVVPVIYVDKKCPENNAVTLKLVPTVSAITRYDPAPGGGNLPQVGTRQANTTVRMKDNETLVIGGLIRDQAVNQTEKVPLLGEIPVIGYLFKSRRTEHHRTELLIFIHVRIVPAHDPLGSKSQDEDTRMEKSQDLKPKNPAADVDPPKKKG